MEKTKVSFAKPNCDKDRLIVIIVNICLDLQVLPP